MVNNIRPCKFFVIVDYSLNSKPKDLETTIKTRIGGLKANLQIKREVWDEPKKPIIMDYRATVSFQIQQGNTWNNLDLWAPDIDGLMANLAGPWKHHFKAQVSSIGPSDLHQRQIQSLVKKLRKMVPIFKKDERSFKKAALTYSQKIASGK